MREIKFRAWDQTRMKMCYKFWSEIGINKPSIMLCNDKSNEFFCGMYDSKEDWTEPILMQYTGLKDKNGVEIYEGDVVTAWSQGSKGTFQIKFIQEGCPRFILFPAWQGGQMWNIHAVEYKKGKKFISLIGEIHETELDGFYDDGLEVIGNIYQNPELI